MRNCNRALLVAACLWALQPAQAFKVAFVTVNGLTFMGNAYHELITEGGLTQLKPVLSTGKTVSFESVPLAMVAVANAETDSQFWDIPFVHFDDESFGKASNRLINLRKAVVSKALAGDYIGARQTLGQALHTLQDFYSHSTWVNRGEPGLAPLGQQILAQPSAAAANCTAGSVISGASLSSGYFNLSQVTPSVVYWTDHYVLLGIELNRPGF